MKTPRDYLSERYRSLNLTDSLAAAFVLVLAIVAIWPHSRLVIDLVLVTAIPGLIAGVVWMFTCGGLSPQSVLNDSQQALQVGYYIYHSFDTLRPFLGKRRQTPSSATRCRWQSLVAESIFW